MKVKVKNCGLLSRQTYHMGMSVMSRVCNCVTGSNVMRSIHGVGELMSQVVLRGGGFLPTTSNSNNSRDAVKTQTEPEKQDILVMDTKLKIIEILQVKYTSRDNISSDTVSLSSEIICLVFSVLPLSSSWMYAWTTGSPVCCLYLRGSLMRVTPRVNCL